MEREQKQVTGLFISLNVLINSDNYMLLKWEISTLRVQRLDRNIVEFK